MEFTSQGGSLVVNNERFILKGCSWFGCETETKCVHGIWSHSVERFLDFLVDHKFNAVRLPFTAELALGLDQTLPTSINYHENKALEGKTAGQVLDYIIGEAAKRGLLVMLDMHCLTCKDGITELWYTAAFPEDQLLEAWSLIVSRYADVWNVFAADLKNEPHDAATWGDGNPATDWRLAAQRIGNAILSINPRLLIFVEGTSGLQTPITSPEGAFWGGSLASARHSPVELSIPKKLVYSPHTYGPGVYMQEYFKDPKFPANMPGIWTRQWGHLLQEPKAGPAVVVGEWGGRFAEGEIERDWAEAFVDYLLSIGATDQFFWCLNPNSGDTGGLLEDDWVSPSSYKLALLERLCPHPSRIEVDPAGQPVRVISGSAPAFSPDRLKTSEAVAIEIPPQQGPQSEGDGDVTGNGVEVDASALPFLKVSAEVINQWRNGAEGWEYQVEVSCWNLGSTRIPDMRIDATRTNVKTTWNLAPLGDGKSFQILSFWTDRGGLEPKASWSFGGIFSTPHPKLVFTPVTA